MRRHPFTGSHPKLAGAPATDAGWLRGPYESDEGRAAFVNAAGEPQELINSQFVTAIPGSAQPLSQYFLTRSDGKVDSWITDAAGTPALIHSHPVVFSQPAIVTNQGAANSSTQAVNTDLALPYDGDYALTLSFNFNNDSANTDIVVYATLAGSGIDLNDRTADPQGNNQILRVETKDAAAGPGGNITGTGVGQKNAFTKVFSVNRNAGPNTLIISVGSEGANVESSIWNIVVNAQYTA